MLVFLILMCVGLVGLGAMALPGVFHHGHPGHTGGAHPPHVPVPTAHAPHPGAPGAAHPGAPTHSHVAPGAPSGHGLLRLVPTPRAVFSLLALYGAFGNLLALTFASVGLAALLALPPALLVEHFLLAPLWKWAFRFQGQPSSPLPALLMEQARAVTAFRNGKGVVQVIRDGRSVQFSARLLAAQAMLPVRVGDTLRIEEIDPEHERVIVSLL